MDLFNEQHRHFINLLNKHQVEYFILGGYAVNLHGYIRTTSDMDVFINPTTENGKRVLAAIAEYGFDTSPLDGQSFEEQLHFNIGEAPFKIDVLNSTVGLTYEEASPRIQKIKYDDLEFNLIHIKDLIKNKKALNTYKDLNDFEQLKKILEKKKK